MSSLYRQIENLVEQILSADTSDFSDPPHDVALKLADNVERCFTLTNTVRKIIEQIRSSAYRAEPEVVRRLIVLLLYYLIVDPVEPKSREELLQQCSEDYYDCYPNPGLLDFCIGYCIASVDYHNLLWLRDEECLLLEDGEGREEIKICRPR